MDGSIRNKEGGRMHDSNEGKEAVGPVLLWQMTQY